MSLSRTNRGELGLLDAISMFTYVIFFMLLFIITGVTHNCSGNKEATQQVDPDTGLLAKLDAEQELIVYLRTPMPTYTELEKKFQHMQANTDYTPDKNTLQFLEENPHFYTGLTYGDFIINLYEARDAIDNENDVFAAVSIALFHRTYNEGVHIPQLAVKYTPEMSFAINDADLAVPTKQTGISKGPSRAGHVHLPAYGEILTAQLTRPTDDRKEVRAQLPSP